MEASSDVMSLATLRSLTQAASSVRRRAESEVLRMRRLSWGGFVILQSLSLNDGSAETGTLARMCDLAKGTLTGMVDTLESQGYVRRESVAGDRRRVIVTLTTTGRAVVADVEREFDSFCIDLSEGIDLSDITVLEQVLSQIIANSR